MTAMEENQKWFNEFLMECSCWFGDRKVDGHVVSIVEAFENDMIDDFVGSRNSELNVMSMLCSIQSLLFQETPDREKAVEMAKAVKKMIGL